MDAELRKRIEQTYAQAASDVTKKTEDYFAKFAKKDAEKRKLVDAGLLSKSDYAQWRKGQMLIGERWKELRDVLAQDLTNADKIAMSITNGYLPDAYAIGHNYGTFLVERGSQINTSYSLYNREAVERLIKNEPRLLPVTKWEVDAPKDLRWNHKHITQQITQGVMQGESIPQIANRLKRVVGMDERAAIRNARTAITGAQNAGRLDAYKRAEALGIPMEKEWLATMDNVTRDSHIDMDGEHVPLDAQFSNGMDHPGGSGPPEEVYNCRCTLIPRIGGYDYRKSDELRWRREEDLGDMTYDEWKETHAGRDKTAPAPQAFNKDEWINILHSQDEATMREWFRQFDMGIQSFEEDSITHYTGHNFEEMNAYLRGFRSVVSSANMDAISGCTEALKKGYIPKEVVVRRGVDFNALKAMLQDDGAIEKIRQGKTEQYIGAIFTDKGFVSTSPIAKGGFSDEVEMVIKLPEGSQAAYIAPISQFKSEKEMLIQRSQMYNIEYLEEAEGRYGDPIIRMFCTCLGGIF